MKVDIPTIVALRPLANHLTCRSIGDHFLQARLEHLPRLAATGILSRRIKGLHDVCCVNSVTLNKSGQNLARTFKVRPTSMSVMNATFDFLADVGYLDHLETIAPVLWSSTANTRCLELQIPHRNLNWITSDGPGIEGEVKANVK